jgi:hypothetical protein
MASKVGLDLPSSNVNASPSTATDSNMATTPAFDIHGIDWLAAQNNNAFDPQLFGDYREPQDNILSGGLYDDNFFTEAFAADFVTPFDMDPTGASLGAAPKKGNLLSEIDDKLKEDDEDEVVPGESEMLTCTNMWYVFISPCLPLMSLVNMILMKAIGRKFKLAHVFSTAKSTWIACARSCSRRRSAVVRARLSRRRISRMC